MLASALFVGAITILMTYSIQAVQSESDMDSIFFQDVDDQPMSRNGQETDNLVGCECMPVIYCNFGEGVIDIRIPVDQSECPHYLEKCCPSNQFTPPSKSHQPSCGTRHSEGVTFKIVSNNSEASYGEFPWMVAILCKNHSVNDINPKVMECGGSIIHPQVVLTGAHCVKRRKNLYVRAGEWDTKTDKESYPNQEKDVKTVIIHEEYYAGGLFNDIALLVLESPLELTEVVDTICLPEKGEIMDDRNCVVTGWGQNSFGIEGKYQEILKKVELPVVPRNSCQEILRTTRLGSEFELHKSFLCAGGQLGKDACKGDGGSPLVCPSKNNPDKYIQAGIVAYGVGCGNAIPALYVNIPYFRSWIDDKMRELNFA